MTKKTCIHMCLLKTQYIQEKCNTYTQCYIFLALELSNTLLLLFVGKIE